MTLPSSRWPDEDARRGWAARTAMSEDARWVADVVYSARSAADQGAYPALLLGQHFVRIAYEGALALRSENPHVGWPPFAELLDHQFASITGRARHVSKLLDDTSRGYDEVLADLGAVYRHNNAVLVQAVKGWRRWLATDLGLYSVEDHVVGASVPIAYRLALDPAQNERMAGESIHEVTQEWGATVAVLQAATLDSPLSLSGTLDLTQSPVSYRDRLAARYLQDKYERTFPLALKMLILMIEGDLNTNRLYLPRTEVGHENSAFRARVVTLYHALSSLEKISAQSPSLDSAGLRDLRSILDDPPTRRVLDRGGKRVRNRCVHYEIRGRALRLDPAQPMHGIVEAVNPDTTYSEFDGLIRATTSRLAEALGAWKSDAS